MHSVRDPSYQTEIKLVSPVVEEWSLYHRTFREVSINLNLFVIFFFYFIFKLYITVLVLPNIKMNPPHVYLWTSLNTHTQSKNSGALMRKQSLYFLPGTWDCTKTRLNACNLYSLISCVDESSLHKQLKDSWTRSLEVGSLINFFLYDLRLTWSRKQLVRVLQMSFYIAFPLRNIVRYPLHWLLHGVFPWGKFQTHLSSTWTHSYGWYQ